MALSTAKTYLYYDVTGTMTKLLDIIDYPDLGGTPTKIDTTDLSASQFKTSILGLQEIPDLVFNANYDLSVYNTISALVGTSQTFELWFGDNGVDGKFTWDGDISIFISGGAVDEARKMQVTLSASTAIEVVS